VKRPQTVKLTLDEAIDAAALYGVYDDHLRRIEAAIGVQIAARGHQITLTGTADQVQQAETVFSRLCTRLRRGDRLTPEAIVHSLRGQNGTGDAAAPSIPVAGPRRAITAKTAAQAEYIAQIRKYDVVVGIGPAGTGKTYLAMAMAVSAFLRREVGRIILTRPAVEAGERLGFLPGDLAEKVNPYLRPLYDALHDMIEPERMRQMIERGDIEIAPLAFMRGRTMSDAFVILDEAQNTTPEQMKMFLTRLGPNARAVITGDVTQIDLPADRASGLIEIQTVLKSVTGIGFFYFTEGDVIRHPLVQEIVKAYARHADRTKKSPTSKAKS